MTPSFLVNEKGLLTVILQCQTPDVAAGRIRNALCQGAEAFGLQTESLLPEYQNPEVYARLFNEMRGRPVYATAYRTRFNKEKTDDELAEEIRTLANCGATLCDVMGDLFSRHPDELTDDPEAVKKQMRLIDELHAMGREVLISSHLYRFLPAERILEIAFEQKRRGADVVKIVSAAHDDAEQIENLRITDLLRRELGAPFLFLSGGVCDIHRRLGIRLGCCMALCVVEHDAHSTSAQPLLSTMKTVRDGLDFDPSPVVGKAKRNG